MDARERRDDVLQLDAVPSGLTDRLRQQVAEMVVRPLQLWQRLLIVWVAGLSLTVGVMICRILVLRTDLTAVQRFYLFAALLLAGLGLVWSVATLRRGVLRPTTDDVLLEGVVWAFLVVIACWELLMDRGDGAMADVIVATVLVGFPFTWGRVRAAELRTRETILRVALHSLDRGPGAAPDSAHCGSGETAKPRRGVAAEGP